MLKASFTAEEIDALYEAQEVLNARENHPACTLADLYDPVAAPVDLVKAHHRLDRAVDKAYSAPKFPSESDRIGFLFELYRSYTSGDLLPIEDGSREKDSRKRRNAPADE